MHPSPAPVEPGMPAPHLYTLGINASVHDPAATLVLDGQVIAAVEDERFTRIRHGNRLLPLQAWALPYDAIDYCLKEAGITLTDVSHVACSHDPELFIGDHAEDAKFGAGIADAPRHLQHRFALPRTDEPPYKWHFVAHHLCHQASAFLAAPFSRCAVMTLDSRGEHAATAYGRYRDSRYEALGEVRAPHSLGVLVEQATAHLGLQHASRLTALAAQGQPRFAGLLREHLVVCDAGQYRLAPIDFVRAVCPPRTPGSAMEPVHEDLAASLQLVLEEAVLQLAIWLRERSGEHDLALAGGLAQNSLLNARLRDAGIFKRVWVQPAAGDAGTALGAALWTDARERRGLEDDSALGATAEASDALSGAVFTLAPRRWQMAHTYLGPAFADEEIEALLKWTKARYRRVDDVAAETAALLALNKTVGWFQGRMEFGPQALGARSILASPMAPHLQARLAEFNEGNNVETAVLAVKAEELPAWFDAADANGGESPFALFTHPLRGDQRSRLAPTALAVCAQTVHRDTNPILHDLLDAVGRATGVPVLANIAFRGRGEPIVATPKHALETFHSTPLDPWVIGSFILEK